MSKKNIVTIGILVVIIILAVVIQLQKTDNMAAPDPQNCTYNVEGEDIVLENGYSEKEIVPGSASKLITRYFGNSVEGDFNGDNILDTAFILTQDAGGSGTFYYIAAALGGSEECKSTNAIFLGDRITIVSTEFEDGKIVVNFKEREMEEPMTAVPSVDATAHFQIASGELIEVH